MSDKIAYLGRDLEDAVQLGLVDSADIPEDGRRLLGTNNSEIIDSLVNDLIAHSLETGKIGFSDAVYGAFLNVKTFKLRAYLLQPRVGELPPVL